jgi:hypothetical protein
VAGPQGDERLQRDRVAGHEPQREPLRYGGEDQLCLGQRKLVTC